MCDNIDGQRGPVTPLKKNLNRPLVRKQRYFRFVFFFGLKICIDQWLENIIAYFKECEWSKAFGEKLWFVTMAHPQENFAIFTLI